jgi:hypothetical protein
MRPCLARATLMHHDVNGAKFRVAFYSMGFEGFIEHSKVISVVPAQVFYGQMNPNVKSR